MSNIEYINMAQLEEKFKSAYKALPSSYKNDSCLSFFVERGKVFAEHDLGGTFQYTRGRWVEVE